MAATHTVCFGGIPSTNGAVVGVGLYNELARSAYPRATSRVVPTKDYFLNHGNPRDKSTFSYG